MTAPDGYSSCPCSRSRPRSSCSSGTPTSRSTPTKATTTTTTPATTAIGMAELAAKIRARFKRRHSALPGMPSLLSAGRSSVRSSDSRGSSLFRTHSHGHHSAGGHDAADPMAADGAGADVDGRSGAESSHMSEGELPGGGQKEGDAIKGGDAAKGGQAVAGVDGLGAVGGQAKKEAGQGDENGTDERGLQPSLPCHISDPSLSSLSPDADLAAGCPKATHDDPVTASAFASGSGLGSGSAAAMTAADQGDPSTAAATLTASATAPAPASAPVAAPTAAAPAPATEGPATPTAPSSTTHSASSIPASTAESSMTASGGPAASDMPGSDRHPSLRKLSSIHEQPSPDSKHPESQQTLAALDDNLDHPPPLAIAPAIAAHPLAAATATTTATSTTKASHAKRTDAKLLEPANLPLPTPASRLGAATSRPVHIPLPQASFGPPAAHNLSPGSLYAISATAPTSPLARYSTSAQAATAGPASGPAPAAGGRPSAPVRRQSLLSNRQSTLIQTLLRGTQSEDPGGLNPDQLLPISGNMVTRKIWVKRPGGSATLVTINEDDVVDDVRDMILRKYANSLGRQFDSPDLTLRIRPGGNQQERMLGPEEPMSRTLDAYFPSGQTIDDALVIDVPLRRTPRASPRAGPPHAPHIQYYVDDARPPETANDYFGPGALSTAHVPVTVTAPATGPAQHTHAISVLNTGQVPQIPSPGNRRARDYRERPERPRLGRQHTSSPTLINLASGATQQGPIASAAIAPHGTQAMHNHGRARSRTHSHSEASDQSQGGAPQPPSMPTPPPAEASAVSQRVATPPPRVASPRPAGSARPKKTKKNTDHLSLPKGMLNGSVPPINVLIVEDNIINLKLLEAFVKRLKVRWSTAMNGRDAVTKWRAGGFHLVLMDIQLPVMSGLDATREIRRLERVNSIGVFSSAASTAPEEVKGEPDEKDRLPDMDLFKSPVIIVALTASSLQSDRHEALAAGCNDFLTKVRPNYSCRFLYLCAYVY